MTKILDGRVVAKSLNQKTLKQINELKEAGVLPTLAIVRADENPDSIQYEKAATRYMTKVGIETKSITF